MRNLTVAGDLVTPDGSSTLVNSGWSDGKSCSGGSKYTVAFTSQIIFLDHNGVTFRNTTTGDTGTVTSVTESPANIVEYSVTWSNTQPVSGDVITWDYDATAGNYKSDATTLMEDSFTAVTGNLAGRAPDKLQVAGNLWTGSIIPDVDGSGRLLYKSRINREICSYDIGQPTFKISYKFRYTTGVNTNTRTGIRLRGSTFNDCVVAQVTASGCLKLLKRVNGEEYNIAKTLLLSINPNSQIMTYVVTDDGTDVSITCVDTNQSISSDVGDDGDGDLTLATDNLIGIDFANIAVANEIIYESLLTQSLNGAALETTSINVTNCIDRAMPEPVRSINFLPYVPDGLIFSRASEATYWAEDGTRQAAPQDTRRYGYDPTTQEYLGLLLEWEKKNLLRYSNDFTDWSGSATITANDELACDGTYIASKCEQVSTSGFEYIEKYIAVMNDSHTYAASIFVRKGGTQDCILSVIFTNGATPRTYRVQLNPSTGSVSPVGEDLPIAYGAEESNLYWRVWLTCANNTTGNTVAAIRFNPTTATITTERFNRDPKTVAGYQHIEGAQLEKGIYPTSYIHNAGGRGIRASDIAVETPISSWFDDGNPGSMQCTIHLPRTLTDAWKHETTDFLVGPHISDGSFDKRIWFTMRPNIVHKQMRLKGDNFTNTQQSAFNSSWFRTMNHAACWATTPGKIFRDGAQGIEDVVPLLIPTGLDRLHFGLHSGTRTIDGYIQTFNYYNVELYDHELAIVSAR